MRSTIRSTPKIIRPKYANSGRPVIATLLGDNRLRTYSAFASASNTATLLAGTATRDPFSARLACSLCELSKERHAFHSGTESVNETAPQDSTVQVRRATTNRLNSHCFRATESPAIWPFPCSKNPSRGRRVTCEDGRLD